MPPSRHVTDLETKKPRVLGNRYEIVRKLGTGQFGTAFLCKDRRTRGDVIFKVLKEISVAGLQPDDTVDAEHEARLLSKLRHPNIVKFEDKFIDGEFFCIITEYCEGGDLDKHVEQCKEKGTTIAKNTVMDWFVQLLLGVDFIHTKKILHRDLKTRNIFLKDNMVKIGDFGISRILMGPSDYASTFIGTPYYMSPEVVKHKGYNSKSDIWSIGCVLYDVCALKHCFEAEGLMNVLYKIVDGSPPDLPKNYPAELNDIYKKMLQKDPEERPTAADILKTLFIANHNAKLPEEFEMKSTYNTDTEGCHGNDFVNFISQKSHLQDLRKTEEEVKLKNLTPRQRLQAKKEQAADQRGKELRAAIKLQQPNKEKRIQTIKKVKKTLCTPVWIPGEHGEGEKLKDALKVDNGDGPDDTLTGNVAAYDVPQAADLVGVSDINVQLNLSGAASASDNRPITPLRNPSEDDFVDGIPSNPETANTYYSHFNDFEYDKSDSEAENEQTVVHNNTITNDEEMESFIGCLQHVLNRPTTEENETISDKITGAYGPKARELKIKNLRLDCEKAMGKEVFEKAYWYLKEVWSRKVDNTMLKAQELRGLEHIVENPADGLLVEQLLFYEEQAERLGNIE